jgi:ABC-type multidrug transport system permease subunit
LFLVSNLHLLVVSIAIVGFLLFFSLAAFIPMAWDFRARARGDISALLDFRMRFISRLIGRIIILTLLATSLLFAVSCFLCLLSIIFPNLLFLTWSLYLDLLAVGMGAATLLSATISAAFISPGELKEILEYYERTTSP